MEQQKGLRVCVMQPPHPRRRPKYPISPEVPASGLFSWILGGSCTPVHDLLDFLQSPIRQRTAPLGGDARIVDNFGNKITHASNSRKHFDIPGKSSHRTLLSARRHAVVHRAICRAQGDGILLVKPYMPPTFKKVMALSSVTPAPVSRSSASPPDEKKDGSDDKRSPTVSEAR